MSFCTPIKETSGILESTGEWTFTEDENPSPARARNGTAHWRRKLATPSEDRTSALLVQSPPGQNGYNQLTYSPPYIYIYLKKKDFNLILFLCRLQT